MFYFYFHPNTYSQIGFSLKLFFSNKLNILLISSSSNNLSSCLITFLFFTPFFKSVTICYGLIWWSMCLFSICACNVFNLTIIVLCIGEKFSFCVFWVAVIYRVVFCQDVKYTPSMWLLLCWLSACTANDRFSF